MCMDSSNCKTTQQSRKENPKFFRLDCGVLLTPHKIRLQILAGILIYKAAQMKTVKC